MTPVTRDSMQSLSELHLHATLMNIMQQRAKCTIARKRRRRLTNKEWKRKKNNTKRKKNKTKTKNEK